MLNRAFRLSAGPVLRYMVPILIVYIFIVIVPLVISLYYSVMNFNNTKFVGLENYVHLVKDHDFWLSYRNNIVIVLFCVLGQVGIAFFLSALLNSKFLMFRNLHRIAIFLPVVLAPVVTGYIWSLIYNYRFGLLNWLLKLVGYEPVTWLDKPNIVLYAVSVPLIWQYIGLYMIIFLAGMQNISKDIFESAEIDGANWLQRTLQITLPLMKSTIRVALIFCVSGTMKVFDHIYVMTGGGPGTSSMVMAQYAYNNAFTMAKINYGSAISIGMLILCGCTLLVMFKLMDGGKKHAD
ncbi:sugar ABC transporter permease [Paenibacillus anseongense]|uniref:carbohydrate ABC transporter permease n=1 Tax=Paenibacillus TaxID=44249 RepID=UPI002DC01477|nr:sugar ABC transporter permease [Paenibacillus anseongense]MEC0267252.1 sugar ABC transporter permease [Paenibacillus anseongense]